MCKIGTISTQMNTKTLKNNCNIYNTFVLENMLVMSDEFLTQTCNTFNRSFIMLWQIDYSLKYTHVFFLSYCSHKVVNCLHSYTKFRYVSASEPEEPVWDSGTTGTVHPLCDYHGPQCCPPHHLPEAGAVWRLPIRVWL